MKRKSSKNLWDKILDVPNCLGLWNCLTPSWRFGTDGRTIWKNCTQRKKCEDEFRRRNNLEAKTK
jgi:hypothetical protein